MIICQSISDDSVSSAGAGRRDKGECHVSHGTQFNCDSHGANMTVELL